MDPEANYATLHEEISKLLERLQAAHEQELGRRRRLRPRKRVTSKVRVEAQRGSEDELHEAQVEVVPLRRGDLGQQKLEGLKVNSQRWGASIVREESGEEQSDFKKGWSFVSKTASRAASQLFKAASMSSKEDAKEMSDWHAQCASFVRSLGFKAFSALMIIANAVFLAFHSNAKMTNAYDVAFEGAVRAPEVHFLELFFATWFVVEVVLLLLAANRDCPLYDFFWAQKEYRWNIFTTLIALEAFLGFFLRWYLQSFSYLYILGIFRAARLVPGMRTRELRKLRKTLVAIIASLWDLLFASLVVCLFLYMYSIFLSNLTVHYFDSWQSTGNGTLSDDDEEAIKNARDYFGSIPKAMLSLWSAISGGNDWMGYAETLQVMDPSGFYFATFIVFIAFCTIGLFNVVTGVFVDSAVEAAKNLRSTSEMISNHREQKSSEEEDLNMLKRYLRRDGGEDGITEDELKKHLKQPDAQAFWAERMQLNASQVKEIYVLYLQLHEAETLGAGINAKDFLDFARRCKGQPSSIDLLTLIYDHTELKKCISQEFAKLHGAISAPKLSPRL